MQLAAPEIANIQNIRWLAAKLTASYSNTNEIIVQTKQHVLMTSVSVCLCLFLQVKFSFNGKIAQWPNVWVIIVIIINNISLFNYVY